MRTGCRFVLQARAQAPVEERFHVVSGAGRPRLAGHHLDYGGPHDVRVGVVHVVEAPAVGVVVVENVERVADFVGDGYGGGQPVVFDDGARLVGAAHASHVGHSQRLGLDAAVREVDFSEEDGQVVVVRTGLVRGPVVSFLPLAKVAQEMFGACLHLKVASLIN